MPLLFFLNTMPYNRVCVYIQFDVVVPLPAAIVRSSLYVYCCCIYVYTSSTIKFSADSEKLLLNSTIQNKGDINNILLHQYIASVIHFFLFVLSWMKRVLVLVINNNFTCFTNFHRLLFFSKRKLIRIAMHDGYLRKI